MVLASFESGKIVSSVVEGFMSPRVDASHKKLVAEPLKARENRKFCLNFDLKLNYRRKKNNPNEFLYY